MLGEGRHGEDNTDQGIANLKSIIAQVLQGNWRNPVGNNMLVNESFNHSASSWLSALNGITILGVAA